ncbi:putative DNA-directed RNA polymerase [Medicago truncatula]|uniref:DNA-directed RNA polymerase n=2 Tax=Medicago truncatula TaxID=3880 RepID=A0A396JGS8_MEDTR|nr:putative DNA-directed RNA polymerase [Medicago truncatula]
MEKEKMWLEFNQFPKKVPLMVVMKAMGMEIDQEVVQLIGRDPRYSFLLMPSIEEYINCRVFTQAQALEYLDSKAKGPRFSNMAAEKDGRAFNILKNEFLANVPMHGDNFRPKCIYLAVMMRRIMDAILNKDAMDDKVCGACGLLGYYNHKLKAGTCSSCKNGKQISNVKVPYACKLLIQELQSMNIVPRLKLEDTKV